MSKKVCILLSMVTMLFVSCSDEATDIESLYSNDISPLVIYASVNGTGKAASRAVITETEDKWSYTDFVDKDVMGFYSSGGNWTVEGGKGGFDNFPLQYDAERGRFTDPEGASFSPSHMDGSQIYMYYPYDANMDESGIKLRQDIKGNDTLRCVDFLSSNSITINSGSAALYGKFNHAFSELIIMRGEGFDNPPANKRGITVVLQQPYTNLKVTVNSEGNWSCTPSLVYDEASELTEDQAREWNAWFGGNYHRTTNDEIGSLAWYVIIPTLSGNNRSVVEYIELCDNDGYWQRVSSLQLSGGNSKYVDPGWRYPMEITIKELVPTVNPFPIIPWSGDVDLTDERTRGINDEIVFADWVRDYNAYLLDPADEDKINALFKYGDKIVDAQNNISWHFYVLSDLDLTKYSPPHFEDGSESNDVIIPKLNDILDGISTVFVNGKFINHSIKGLSKTFIDKLENNGSVQNFNFVNPRVENAETSASPAGIIVNTMTNTSVINCNINNGSLYNPGGPAGMVAGKMVDGTVNNCTLSGFIIAGSTADAAANIVGEIEGNPTFSENDANAVVDRY